MEPETTPNSAPDAPVGVQRIVMNYKIQQTIYEHGGSRIWREVDGSRDLIADTYQDDAFARAIRDFTEEWFSS